MAEFSDQQKVEYAEESLERKKQKYEDYFQSVKEKQESKYDPNKGHFTPNVLLASFVAGGLAAFCTNSLEVLTVNKQSNPDFKVWKFIQQPGALYKMLF